MCWVFSIFDLSIPFLFFSFSVFSLFLGEGLILDRNSLGAVYSKAAKLPAIDGNILQNYLIWQDSGIFLTLSNLKGFFRETKMVNVVFSCFIILLCNIQCKHY